jgi:hypothetical protein
LYCKIHNVSSHRHFWYKEHLMINDFWHVFHDCRMKDSGKYYEAIRFNVQTMMLSFSDGGYVSVRW